MKRLLSLAALAAMLLAPARAGAECVLRPIAGTVGFRVAQQSQRMTLEPRRVAIAPRKASRFALVVQRVHPLPPRCRRQLAKRSIRPGFSGHTSISPQTAIMVLAPHGLFQKQPEDG